MAEKNKIQDVPTFDELNALEEGYIEKLDTDKRYSVSVIDPDDKYNLSQSQKDFIKYYVNWKNIPLASKMAGIDKDTGMQYYNTYGVKREIDRISMALYHRAFAVKMLNLDEIGGYLTSLVMDINVPEADKLNVKDKIGVMKLLAEINEKKQKAIADPSNIIDVDITEQLTDLSVGAIKTMIATSSNGKDRKTKEQLIEEIKDLNDGRLSMEELSHLSMLPVKDLIQMVSRLVEEADIVDGEHIEN